MPSIRSRSRRRALRSCLAALALTLLAGAPLHAQVDTRPPEGIADRTPQLAAFVHARLLVKPGEVIEDGTLVVRDGVIVAVGRDAKVPAGAARIDLGGKTVFAGFIDSLSAYAQPAAAAAAPAATGRRGASPSTPQPQAGAAYWNPRVHPQDDVAATVKPDPKAAEKLRALGFTDALSVPQRGIFRGQSALYALSDAAHGNDALIRARVAQHLAFESSGWGSAEYPGSLMGAIALVRQTLYDARWQQQRLAWQAKRPEAERTAPNDALAALAPLAAGRQPAIFATDDELDYDRALAIAREFGLKLVLAGNGHEYRMAPRLAAAGVPVIVPLTYPEAPAVEDPDAALDVDLAELEHWRWAPYNARVLAEAGVPFAFTAAGLNKPESEFWKRVRKAVADGLDERTALAALTTQPAAMLGVADKLGTLEPGRLAHFVVADADLLYGDDARIYETWIDGKRYRQADPAAPDPRGAWNLAWSGGSGPASLEFRGKDGELDAKAGGASFPATQDGARLLLYVPGKLFGSTRERVVVVAQLDDGALDGRAELEDGRRLRVHGTLAKPTPRALAALPAKPPLPSEPLRFPAGAYGRNGLPQQPAAVVVRHATLWTQGPQGVLEDADLLVEKGRIAAVGRNLKAPSGVLEIDGRGKFVSPGIIDPHSHIAVSRGVNEGTHAVTSEVRIGDVLDPTDMIIYRQLAGGTTSALVLHGSANPIGGQSQIIKLRWGADAEGLKFKRAPETIKFALGENVKQSNWGDDFTTRYPQTRMGVEQIDLDSFLAAQAYGAALKAGHAEDGGPLRRDLRLQALWEVLQGERLVQIHSYRQDEILGFIRLARQFRIVPTFQHVLEGYKVADEIAKLGAGASTFSDWWAYKFEVRDAIPYNGALMTRQGVTVSFNSDDDEMGRRLNTEAAKSVKYGGLTDAEALALVTINPARQLHIDKYVGSLEPGKDADFVIWNAPPLSTQAVPQQTWVDGRKYFDRADDLAERARIESERAELIAAALPERVKALARDAGKKDADKPGEAPEAAPALLQGDELLRRYAARRPIYHDDEPVNGCTDAESH